MKMAWIVRIQKVERAASINLNSGRYVWKIRFGEYPELAAQGLRNTGTESCGGAVVTAGGLLFFGAISFDKEFHAFDKRTEATLPAGGNATPATYRANGRQYVVIAAGSGRPDTQTLSGSKLLAFALEAD